MGCGGEVRDSGMGVREAMWVGEVERGSRVERHSRGGRRHAESLLWSSSRSSRPPRSPDEARAKKQAVNQTRMAR